MARSYPREVNSDEPPEEDNGGAKSGSKARSLLKAAAHSPWTVFIALLAVIGLVAAVAIPLLSDKIVVVDGKIDNVSEEVRDVRQDVRDIRSDVNAVRGTVDSLRGDIGYIRGRLDGMGSLPPKQDEN